MQRGSRRISRRQLTRSSFGQVSSGATLGGSSHLSPGIQDSDDESALFIGAMETIALPSDDSDNEYFDAQGKCVENTKVGYMYLHFVDKRTACVDREVSPVSNTWRKELTKHLGSHLREGYFPSFELKQAS